MMKNSKQFNIWMDEVDQAVLDIAGCSVHDLPDYLFRDAFQDGESPRHVACELLQQEGFPFPDMDIDYED